MTSGIDRSALPSALRARSSWLRLSGDVPAMIARPLPPFDQAPAPMFVWMHGRTAHKELDPGRYLRLIRSGIAVCAVDLPGHGERFDQSLQEPDRTLDVVLGMESELDDVLKDLCAMPDVDGRRLALGGMSAGGMAALARLCRPHDFAAAAVEATTGDWRAQRARAMFRDADSEMISRWNPIERLGEWRDIPLQAIHSRLDEWVSFAGQEGFIEALQSRTIDPRQIDFVVYPETGAPAEHIGFGRMAADAKERQRAFLHRHLIGP